jgi:hypothetical protein
MVGRTRGASISSRAASFVAVAGAAIMIAAGCSSSGSGGGGGGGSTSSSSLCSDVNQLQSSLQDLKQVEVVKNGTSSLQTALNNVKQSATKVGDASKGEFKPQVDALQAALSSLSSALKNIRANGVAPVQQAAKSVQTAGTELESAVRAEDCK